MCAMKHSHIRVLLPCCSAEASKLCICPVPHAALCPHARQTAPMAPWLPPTHPCMASSCTQPYIKARVAAATCQSPTCEGHGLGKARVQGLVRVGLIPGGVEVSHPAGQPCQVDVPAPSQQQQVVTQCFDIWPMCCAETRLLTGPCWQLATRSCWLIGMEGGRLPAAALPRLVPLCKRL
jgi:hypothetical protein